MLSANRFDEVIKNCQLLIQQKAIQVKKVTLLKS